MTKKESNESGTEQVRDTNTYTYKIPLDNSYSNYTFYIDNNLDADVDHTVKAVVTDPDDGSEVGFDIVSSQTIPKNDTGFDTVTDHHNEIHIEVTAKSTPTSGKLKVFSVKN